MPLYVKGTAPGNSTPLFNTVMKTIQCYCNVLTGVHNIGFYSCENDTVGVICEIPSPDNTVSVISTPQIGTLASTLHRPQVGTSKTNLDLMWSIDLH